MPTQHLLIKGKVQGVFFRATAREVAEKIGLTGWVKNTPTGDVEATVSGTDEQVDKFRSWCESGPERAKVEKVIAEKVPEKSFEKFTVIR